MTPPKSLVVQKLNLRNQLLMKTLVSVILLGTGGAIFATTASTSWSYLNRLGGGGTYVNSYGLDFSNPQNTVLVVSIATADFTYSGKKNPQRFQQMQAILIKHFDINTGDNSFMYSLQVDYDTAAYEAKVLRISAL